MTESERPLVVLLAIIRLIEGSGVVGPDDICEALPAKGLGQDVVGVQSGPYIPITGKVSSSIFLFDSAKDDCFVRNSRVCHANYLKNIHAAIEILSKDCRGSERLHLLRHLQLLNFVNSQIGFHLYFGRTYFVCDTIYLLNSACYLRVDSILIFQLTCERTIAQKLLVTSPVSVGTQSHH